MYRPSAFMSLRLVVNCQQYGTVLVRNPFRSTDDSLSTDRVRGSRTVGGDLFDFFLLDPEHLAFVVGDVSGKGVPAALFMAIARTVLRATADRHEQRCGN